jgi:hypothetical protein
VARVTIVLVVLIAVAGCGASGAEREPEAGPAQPEDDPEHGIYNYDHARELGIRVDAIAPADQLCPTGVEDDGFSAEELDTPEEVAELEPDGDGGGVHRRSPAHAHRARVLGRGGA